MTATYRLQLQADFGFDRVRELLPYFVRLGVSHLYLSPITEARSGSTHGYDVTDHNAVREELGGREALDRLLDDLARHGLKAILDWVPNHAGVGSDNESWQDVLALGPHSHYARYFDVDWHPLKPELDGKILLPFLGKPYGEALDTGELGIGFDDGRFYATYFENRFALSPATYHLLLEAAMPAYERSEAYWDLKELHEAYADLDRDAVEKMEALRLRLAAFAERADPRDWPALQPEVLHELLEEQWWRLSFWKTAGSEINYRRFFDINELVGLRMEDEHVFWDSHRLLGELLTHEAVEGVRIDHIDGMFEPHGYLRLLEQLGAGSVWVEKILAPGETLPDAWPVEGTTGYAFMNDVMRVLIDPAGELPLDRAYRRWIDGTQALGDVVHRSKHLIMRTMLSSELSRLAYELDRISEADYHTRDFTLEALRDALAEVVAAFDRYRTYLPHDPDGAAEVVSRAIHLARQRSPAAEPTVYDFIERIILGEVRDDLTQAQRAWVGRFQQYTAPVAAKGVEDTAFYRYYRLAALNEVGGEPDHFAVDPQAFHAHARFRAMRYPRNLVATATHDHKRGEDTRMRLIGLGAMAERWEEFLGDVDPILSDHRGRHGPDRNQEYLFLQVLVALWHDAEREELSDRLAQYMLKAARESKQRTSWINPIATYEEDLEAFVRGVCADERLDAVISPLSDLLAGLGFHHSISQLILKLTTPGVPDFYRGTELLDLSLVDPDNRRPVDFELRQRLLNEMADLIEDPSADRVRALIQARDPKAKLFIMARLLKLRRERPTLWEGEYLELGSEDDGDAGIAFARIAGSDSVVIYASRVPMESGVSTGKVLPGHLAEKTWHEWLTGTTIEAMQTLEGSHFSLGWGVLVESVRP